MNIRKVSHFNYDLYKRIRESRCLRGLPVENLNVEIKDHELIGKRIYSTSEECEYTVDRVHKMWDKGWFIVIMAIDSHNSHRTIYWQNINCKDEYILQRIDEAREEILYIDDNGEYFK